MSELCDPTDAELRALCASATGPSHLESLIPLANYRDIVALRRKLHEFPESGTRGWALLPVVSGQEHRVAPDELSSIEARPQERMA